MAKEKGLQSYKDIEELNKTFRANALPADDEVKKIVEAALNRQKKAEEATANDRKASAKRDMIASCILWAGVTVLTVAFWAACGFDPASIAAEATITGIAGLNIGRYLA